MFFKFLWRLRKLYVGPNSKLIKQSMLKKRYFQVFGFEGGCNL